MSIIPNQSLSHCVALLPAKPEAKQYLEIVRGRRPQLKVPAALKAVAQPRPCVFGRLTDGPWEWQLVIDLGPLPQASWRAGFGTAPAPEHRAHAFVFLLAAPPKVTGFDKARALLDVAWPWLQAGASALALPAAGLVHATAALEGVDPRSMDADTALALLVAPESMGVGRDRRTWIRTRGMTYFGLPDLCCSISGPPESHPDEARAVETLFASLGPHLIALDRPLQPGETLTIGARTWGVLPESELAPAPASVGPLTPLAIVPPDRLPNA